MKIYKCRLIYITCLLLYINTGVLNNIVFYMKVIVGAKSGRKISLDAFIDITLMQDTGIRIRNQLIVIMFRKHGLYSGALVYVSFYLTLIN